MMGHPEDRLADIAHADDAERPAAEIGRMIGMRAAGGPSEVAQVTVHGAEAAEQRKDDHEDVLGALTPGTLAIRTPADVAAS